MSEERHIPGPPSELADTLNHWRELFQRKHAEDFENLRGLTAMEEPIFSFLVDYADIDEDDLLSLRFNEFPEETVEQAKKFCVRWVQSTQTCAAFFAPSSFLTRS